MFSGPFRKLGVSLATYVRVYRKGDTVHVKGIGPVQKGTPPNVPMKECAVSPSGGPCTGGTLAQRTQGRTERMDTLRAQTA